MVGLIDGAVGGDRLGACDRVGVNVVGTAVLGAAVRATGLNDGAIVGIWDGPSVVRVDVVGAAVGVSTGLIDGELVGDCVGL